MESTLDGKEDEVWGRTPGEKRDIVVHYALYLAMSWYQVFYLFDIIYY